MPSPEVAIISLDGLNNNGKTTQLNHLKGELCGRGVPTVIRRGDGSRKGLGATEADPPSEWWKNHYPAIVGAGLDGLSADKAAAIASRQLMSELYELKTEELPATLASNGQSRGVILLNRGPVSRFFVARRYNPNISLDEALGIDEESHFEEVIPDKILVLHAAKETLLARNETRTEGGAAKRKFNRLILTNYYNDFLKTLETLPPQLAERTTVIDSTPLALEVGRVALSAVMRTLQYDA